MSRTIKYVGPHDEVEFELPNGLTRSVKRNETFESEWPELSDSLLEQEGNWEAVRSTKSNDKKGDS